MHWHPSRVNDIAFSPDGNDLISGGEEAVLVIWQLATRAKSFLPRLGAEITSVTVSPDQKLYAIGLRDNSMRLVSALNNSIKQAVSGLQYANMNRKKYPLKTGVIIDPRSNDIAMSGYLGSIQFFNPRADKHVLQLDVTPRNRVMRIESKEVAQVHATCLAFSADGQWMATVDVRDDLEFVPEVYLKFWSYNANEQTYVVNTRVDHPHDSDITSLKFSPIRGKRPIAVTTSLDNKLKIWQLTEGEDAHWSCLAVASHKETRAVDSAFSPDGSLLAIAFGPAVTLWDPTTCVQQATLAHPQKFIRRLAFVAGAPFLVASTDSHLYVWNLLTCTVWWSIEISTEFLAVDPKSSLFAVIEHAPHSEDKSSRILVFNASSPVPITIRPLDRPSVAVSFLPQDADSSDILIFDENGEYHSLRKEGEKQAIDPAVQPSAVRPLSFLFSSIYGKPPVPSAGHPTLVAATAPERVAPVGAPTASEWASTAAAFLDAPSHVVPPPAKLAPAFLASFVRVRKAPEIDGQAETAAPEEEVDAMDVDPVEAVAEEDREAVDFAFLEESFRKMVLKDPSTQPTDPRVSTPSPPSPPPAPPPTHTPNPATMAPPNFKDLQKKWNLRQSLVRARDTKNFEIEKLGRYGARFFQICCCFGAWYFLSTQNSTLLSAHTLGPTFAAMT
ncbi:hypothetical protein BDK51DRAFT_42094 [Blyttiomyces helicus]|uniref:WD repeat-containing protein 75 second beta-propeller domain-containing protein n=1 Tax=Blyttiomyces helicus TaxID=388810 RepID=A0A4P9W177_9FUNG|nr:hypothetical protein BDK51DRAFT_42094 [Blyttiomyces helicus]|eukprot:RKO85929.1 hypothetical protein BDK51DRAFT_42094 [Blyttiomyces helicus]